MGESGKNITPDKLPAQERATLFDACDRAIRRIVETLTPRYVIGVGGFATTRLQEALLGEDLRIGTMLHPSPASPLANRGWAAQAETQLAELGIETKTDVN
jgi:single-strand selective monofunctional uracil DNA glycosylase